MSDEAYLEWKRKRFFYIPDEYEHVVKAAWDARGEVDAGIAYTYVENKRFDPSSMTAKSIAKAIREANHER